MPRSRLIVDGYNVTKQAWATASLEAQRSRLVSALGPLVARLMTFGAFAVITCLTEKNIVREDYSHFSGLGFKRPFLAMAMSLFMLGLPVGLALAFFLKVLPFDQAVERCRKANPNALIISRAHSDEEEHYLQQLGANVAIMGEREIGLAMIGLVNPENIAAAAMSEVSGVVWDLRSLT